MILAFAKSRGYNALVCYLPIALLNLLIGIVVLSAKFMQKRPQASRDSFTSMSAKHFAIIGFAYTFGYMIPTIRLIQILDRDQLYVFMAAYAIRCLSCDLVFTILLSKMML
jgi:hypothetical protein